MNKALLFLPLVTLSLYASAQPNCNRTSVGYPPINDLGAGTWRGVQGGLYPNGSNQRPAAHNAAGLAIANQIKPLNTSGNPDTTAGKVVWLSIGMSNTTQETQEFIPLTDTLAIRSPWLKLIDGAQGGQDIDIIVNPSATFWTNINNRLQQSGLTSAQVQAVWFKEAEAGPNDTSFASYPAALKAKFRTAMQIIKAKFPNVKLCYLSSRIYAGYASSSLNPEPYAYYSGWSVKSLIEDQINGDTALSYSGSNARVPWLSWGPYLWADGTTPRSDGLTWLCPDDYLNDGTHPSTKGRDKVAAMLLKFFTTDETSTPWFLRQSPTSISPTVSGSLVPRIFPNPAKGKLSIIFPSTIVVPETIALYDAFSRKLLVKSTNSNRSVECDISGLPAGIYYLKAGVAAYQISKE